MARDRPILSILTAFAIGVPSVFLAYSAEAGFIRHRQLPDNNDLPSYERKIDNLLSDLLAEEVKKITTASNDEIIKAPLDKREYEYFTLPNELRVMLCSDPAASNVAAAMDVHVGATSDPVDVPGLAHFNEHMLFLGTEKYPDEDSFSAFLNSNGGYSNAYTAAEDTVYYFNMNSGKGFGEGLDRFGSFFSGPLFNANSTGRELNAIESENAKNLQNDGFRMYQLSKARFNKNHPMSKFFTGNKYTLKEQTEKKNIDLRSELQKFYTAHYSSNQMTLAVVGTEPLSTLKEYVEKAFSEIPNRKVGKPEDAWKGKIHPFSENSIVPSMGHILEVVPVSEARTLDIEWPMPFTSESDRMMEKMHKPSSYLGHILGHEGEGSLLSFLKKQGWASSVSAGGSEYTSDVGRVSVSVSLSQAGLEEVDSVIESVFSYVDMLSKKPLQDYHFEQFLKLNELSWRYQTKSGAENQATFLATSMQDFSDDPTKIIVAPQRLALKDENGNYVDLTSPRTSFASQRQLDIAKSATQDIVKKMTVDNAMITIISKTFEGKTDKKEFWYQTDYATRQFSSEAKQRWSQPERGMAEIDYPKPNQFIPTENGLKVKIPVNRDDANKPMTMEERMTPVEPPKVVRDDDRWTVYFKQDNKFGEPKASVNTKILVKGLVDSPLDTLYSMLFTHSASDSLNEYTYGARLAGLGYGLSVGRRGIDISFGGYNEKLKDYASEVTSKIVKDHQSLLPKDQAKFDRYRDLIKRSLHSFAVKQPYEQSQYYIDLTLNPPQTQFSNSELLEAVPKLTIEGLKSYADKVFSSSGKGVALIQGNLDKEEALSFLSTIDSNFPFTPTKDLPEHDKPLPLPVTPTQLTIQTPNAQNPNSVSYVILQSLAEDDKSHLCVSLISSILKEPFFDELRTKQQLGYIVSSGARSNADTTELVFLVQSSVAPVETLTHEIMKYLGDAKSERLEKVSDDELEVLKEGIFKSKTQRDETLGEEVNGHWYEIVTEKFRFDRMQKQGAEVLRLTKDDLLKFWDDLVKDGNKRMLISEVVAAMGDAKSETMPLKSYGFDAERSTETSAPLEPKIVRLGIDDINAFRLARKQATLLEAEEEDV